MLAVGDNTNQGKAGLSMNIEEEQTPLQNKLDTIANQIGKLGFAVAILVFIIAVRLRGIGLSSKAEEFFQLFLNYPIFDFDSPLKIVILQLVVESRSFFSRSALSQPDSKIRKQ